MKRFYRDIARYCLDLAGFFQFKYNEVLCRLRYKKSCSEISSQKNTANDYQNETKSRLMYNRLRSKYSESLSRYGKILSR